MGRAAGGQLLRFAANGGVATAVHAGCLYAALAVGVVPALANGFAFLCAVLVTYGGQRWWVFNRPPVALSRFAFVVALGLLLQVGGMALWVHLGGHVWLGWFALTLLVPFVSFVLMRFWVFIQDPARP
jgi:putative flippase GtrA